MPTLNYYLDHPRKNGKLKITPVTIYLAVTDSKRININTEIRVLPKDWNFKKQEVKHTNVNHIEINRSLESLKQRSMKYILEKGFVDKSIMRPNQDTDISMSTRVYEYMDAKINKRENELSSGYVKNMKATKNLFKRKFPNLRLKHLSENHIQEFLDSMRGVKRDGYIHSLLTKIKGIFKNDKFIDWSQISLPKKISSDQVIITWDELYKFKQAKLDKDGFSLKTWDFVKKSSFLRAITGLRYSDMLTLSRSMIHESGKQRYIKITTVKTRDVITLPLTKEAEEIINEYDCRFNRISTSAYHRYTKEIAKSAKLDRVFTLITYKNNKRIEQRIPINKLVGTHTFRRAFARKLYDEGVRIESIKNLLGHLNSRTTMTYIGLKNTDAMNDMVQIIHKLT